MLEPSLLIVVITSLGLTTPQETPSSQVDPEALLRSRPFTPNAAQGQMNACDQQLRYLQYDGRLRLERRHPLILGPNGLERGPLTDGVRMERLIDLRVDGCPVPVIVNYVDEADRAIGRELGEPQARGWTEE